MSYTVITYPDGTKCYSGPSCARHGYKANGIISTVADFDSKLAEFDKDSKGEGVIYHPRYSFPIEKLDGAINEVEKANRKLERSGVEERFTYAIDTSIKEHNGEMVEYATLQLSHPVLKVNGWSFIAAHEFTPTGKATSYFMNEEAVGSDREINQACEHCGSNRKRERVYWVKDESGEIKQVGSSCLKAFLGVTPSGLNTLTADMGFDEYVNTGEYSNSVVYDKQELVGAALIASNRGETFLSRSGAYGNQMPTADVVLREWGVHSGVARKDEEIMAEAQRILDWSASLPENDDTSQYMRNLKIATSESHVKKKHVPLVVSAVKSYYTQQAKEQAVQERKKSEANIKREYLAPVGAKIAATSATVKMRRTYDNAPYGTTTVWVFQTDEGHVLKWNASSYNAFEEGDRVNIKSATVKKHDTYNDIPQTILTRAKLDTIS